MDIIINVCNFPLFLKKELDICLPIQRFLELTCYFLWLLSLLEMAKLKCDMDFTFSGTIQSISTLLEWEE